MQGPVDVKVRVLASGRVVAQVLHGTLSATGDTEDDALAQLRQAVEQGPSTG